MACVRLSPGWLRTGMIEETRASVPPGTDGVKMIPSPSIARTLAAAMATFDSAWARASLLVLR